MFFEFDEMLGANLSVRGRLEQLRPCQCGFDQEPMFASRKTSSFGFVLCAAGPVAPSTCEVTRTKVA